MPEQKIYVYGPEGERQKHTRANARDLVTHLGWTFKAQGGKFHPTDTMPGASKADPKKLPPKSQEIFDGQGGSELRMEKDTDEDDAPAPAEEEAEIVEEDDETEGGTEHEAEFEEE